LPQQSKVYNPHVRSSAKFAFRTVVCALIVPAVVLFYKHGTHANVTTVALTFLLAVLVVSANWGFWYAAFVALLSTLSRLSIHKIGLRSSLFSPQR
jgi:K+-sensing histidine kinase KdpD